MSQARPPLGVTIVHQYYPGFIDLPPNSQYLIRSPDLMGAIHVLEHVRPLVITDFDNGLVNRPDNLGRVWTDIIRPITTIDDDTIAANATGFEGRSGPTIAVEKNIKGRIFYQDIYTSLHVCYECFNIRLIESLVTHRPLLSHFIAIYRHLNPHMRLSIVTGMPDEATPIRIGHYRYSSEEQELPFEERIIHAWPKELKMTIVALGRGAHTLHDHMGSENAKYERAEQIGSHLRNGFALTENLLEIERLADLAFNSKLPRSAISEAMSILEVSILAHQKHMGGYLKRAKKITKPNETTWKFLIEAILPALLDLYNGDKGPVMKRAKEVLQIRHDVTHCGHNPTLDEANMVLSFVRFILTIFERPESFKANWKLK